MLVEVIEYLQDIKVTIDINGIQCPSTLVKDKNVFDLLYGRAVKLYETAKHCTLLRDQKLFGLRNQLCHRREGEHSEKGFNQLTPENYWDYYFGENSKLAEIKNKVEVLLQNPIIALSVQQERITNLKPRESLLPHDTKHLVVINKITDSLKNGTICFIALLYLLSRTMPLPKANLFSIVRACHQISQMTEAAR